MRSVSRTAAIAVLVVAAGEFLARFAIRQHIQTTTFNDDIILFATTGRQLHAVAVVLAVAAFAVALCTARRRGWHWLAWGLFCGWVTYANSVAQAAPRVRQPSAFELYYMPPSADLRDGALHSFDATVPVYVDLIGAALLAVAVTVHVMQSRPSPPSSQHD